MIDASRRAALLLVACLFLLFLSASRLAMPPDPCYRLVFRNGTRVEATGVSFLTGKIRFRLCASRPRSRWQIIELAQLQAVYDPDGHPVFPGGPDAYRLVLHSNDTLYASDIWLHGANLSFRPYPRGSGPVQKMSRGFIREIVDPAGSPTYRDAGEKYRITLQNGDTLLADHLWLVYPNVRYRRFGANGDRIVNIPEKTVRDVYDSAGKQLYPIDTSRARMDPLATVALIAAVLGLVLPAIGYTFGILGLAAMLAGGISWWRTRRRRHKFSGRQRATAALVLGIAGTLLALFASTGAF
jgi:hypothetical protein